MIPLLLRATSGKDSMQIYARTPFRLPGRVEILNHFSDFILYAVLMEVISQEVDHLTMFVYQCQAFGFGQGMGKCSVHWSR